MYKHTCLVLKSFYAELGVKNICRIVAILSGCTLTVFCLSSCKESGKKSFDCTDFVGTSWELVSAATPEGVEVPNIPARPVFVSFFEKDAVAGMSGVNRFNAPVKIENAGDGTFNVKFGMAASTRMAGPFMLFEQHFFKMLSQTDLLLLNGEILDFSSKGEVLMRFKRNDSLQ